MARKEIVGVNLDPRDAAAIRAIARARGVPAAVLFREAIGQWVEEHRAEVPPDVPDPRQLRFPETG